MGIRAGLTQIATDLFEQVVAGGAPKFPDEPWHDFHVVYRAKGPPLSLAIAGDHLHSKNPHTLDEFCDGNHEYYIGFASPQLVQQVAEVLTTLNASDYKRWKSELFGDQYNCGETFFPALKTAYEEAAACSQAQMIVIC